VVAASHRPPVRWSRLAAAVGTLLTLLLLVLAPAGASEPVTLLYFGADGCPYCAQMESFLDDLEERSGDDLEVVRHELSSDPAARDRWVRELAQRGHRASGVPVAILGDQVWLGFDARIGARIEQAVAAAVEDRAPPELAGGIDEPTTGDTTVTVPLIGEVDAGARSALAATALIALVDGFNPCSLWVLVVLLAMVLNAGASRGRIALVGGTFLTVTGVIYGAFIAGVFTVLGSIEHLGAIRIGVAMLALFVGAVNVKDHLAYKKGLSFTIPDRFKPRIYRGGREIRRTDRPLPAVLGTTVALAAGISLVELPCTAGFPVIWSGIVRTQGVEGTEFVALLALYLVIYILDELVLFTGAVVTLRVGRFEERHGRLLKLVGGSVMIALGTTLLAAPQLVEDLAAAVLVILGAVAVALVFDRVHRRVTAAP
jgi:cytochrome c biogenesis protein CcdA/glutaredoxin